MRQPPDSPFAESIRRDGFAFRQLENRILEAAAIARQNQVVPDEVWLGPEEANIVLAEVCRQSAERGVLYIASDISYNP